MWFLRIIYRKFNVNGTEYVPIYLDKDIGIDTTIRITADMSGTLQASLWTNESSKLDREVKKENIQGSTEFEMDFTSNNTVSILSSCLKVDIHALH